MSLLLNGGDVQVGKVYAGVLPFKEGTIYRSPSTGATFRFCVLDKAYTGLVINGMALSGSSVNGSSQPSLTTGAYDGIAQISYGAVNAIKPSVLNAPNYGIWAQTGGLSVADIFAGSVDLDVNKGLSVGAIGKLNPNAAANPTAEEDARRVGYVAGNELTTKSRIALWSDTDIGQTTLANWFIYVSIDIGITNGKVFPQLKVGETAGLAHSGTSGDGRTGNSNISYIVDMGGATYGLMLDQLDPGNHGANANAEPTATSSSYNSATDVEPVDGSGGNPSALGANAKTILLGNNSEISPGADVMLTLTGI